MTDNNTLDDIASDIGEIVEEQQNDSNKQAAREGEEFDDEEYRRDKEDYDGGW